jgi:GxxExxY protein
MPEIILKDEVYAIAGAAMEVYYTIGTGFLEAIYQEALEIELSRRKIPFESQKPLALTYKDIVLRSSILPI